MIRSLLIISAMMIANVTGVHAQKNASVLWVLVEPDESPNYLMVGRHEFYAVLYAHKCMKVTRKYYRDIKVTEHKCIVEQLPRIPPWGLE